jgi:glycosyltransferase involved in cell wall biosynthesis
LALPHCSVIVSTYNWPAALELVLLALGHQSHAPDEILIADDGSDHTTRDLIDCLRPRLSMPLQHVWHPDHGFRKALILNKALAKARSRYIVQLDGDCVPHRHFVEDHLRAAQPGYYLYGARAHVSEQRLAQVYANKRFALHAGAPGIRKRSRALRLPTLGRLYRPHAKLSAQFRGCNCSYWRSDAVDINGYDESFEGWGREDSEFAARLHHAGLHARRLRYRGIVFHLDHPVADKGGLAQRNAYEAASRRERRLRCKNGLDAHLHPASPQ